MLPTTMMALRKPQATSGLVMDHDTPVPEVGPGDVLIAVSFAGLCGTDKHIWDHDEWAAARVAPATIVGHECSGTIVTVGDGVTRVKPGQRVSVEGHIGCGTCMACRTGDAHICAAVDIIGVDRDGCFAEYLCMPEENVWVLDERINDRHAALMDPLGNAVHTVMTAGVSARTVLVTGAGVIGLLAIAVARLLGASRVIATDVRDDRLELARDMGADVVVRADDPGWVGEVRSATGGQGPEVLLEVSGSPVGLCGGLEALRNGGVASLLGLASRPVEIDLAELVIFKGLTLHGVNGRRMFETWYQAESLVLSGRLPLDRFLSAEVPLDKPQQAFEIYGQPGILKVLFDVRATADQAGH